MRRALCAELPKLRGQWRRIFDRADAGYLRARVGEAEQLDGRTLGKKCDRRKIAAQNAEEINLTMRQVADAVAIQINLGAAPEIAGAIHRPSVAVAFGNAGFHGTQIAIKNVFREAIRVRVRAELQADIVLAHR